MYRIASGVSWPEAAGWSRTQPALTLETPHEERYARLVHLASPALGFRPDLHRPRLPPPRRVDHRHSDLRRRAHHHSVTPSLGLARQLESPGVLRRGRRLERRLRHSWPDSPVRGDCRSRSPPPAAITGIIGQQDPHTRGREPSIARSRIAQPAAGPCRRRRR